MSKTRVIAVANQKGGVAKTTTVASLGTALAELGQRVLLVDLDPQACLTFSLGIDPEDLELSIHHVLTKGVPASEVMATTEDGVDLLPATIELARAEADLLTRTGREYVIRTVVEELDDDYDWVLLDCPPSLGVLTVAALTAATGVLIPLQCETLSHRGVGQLLDTVHDVRRFTNRKLEVWGVLPTLYDGRTTHARAGARDDLGDLRPRGDRAADPEVDPVRRSPGRGPLDPGHVDVQQGRRGLPRGCRQSAAQALTRRSTPQRPAGCRSPNRLHREYDDGCGCAVPGPACRPRRQGSPPGASERPAERLRLPPLRAPPSRFPSLRPPRPPPPLRSSVRGWRGITTWPSGISRPLVPGAMPMSWKKCSELEYVSGGSAKGRSSALLIIPQRARSAQSTNVIGDAGRAGAAGATDPVDVGLLVLGAGVVDDVGDAVTSMPRAATSVATRTSTLPSRNARSAFSRAACARSPCSGAGVEAALGQLVGDPLATAAWCG